MKSKLPFLFGAILLLAFAGFSLSSFQDSLTPYVTFEEAQAMNRIVQVAGGLQQGSSAYDSGSESLSFVLIDPESGATIPVRYKGLKPANFEDAISIVAIGRWDRASQEMHADKLLVKCPSKYQGAEVEKSYS